MNQLLKVNNLIVSFENPRGGGEASGNSGELTAVKGVSLDLAAGETLALVGESGCGKTVLCKSMLHILCEKGRVKEGEILLDGRELTGLMESEMIPVRGGEIAMVFQDPMTALDPAFSVGEQIAEVIKIHGKASGKGPAFVKAAKKRALELMELVQIPEAEVRYHQRPYQFSGGMRQRIAIAIALAGNPKLLLADEPTTALDEDTEKEILKLLKDIQRETGVAILFITHDLSLVEGMAERVAIMKDGCVVEEGRVRDVFSSPAHEYTRKLLGYLDYRKGKGHNHRGHRSEDIISTERPPKKRISVAHSEDSQVVLAVDSLCKTYRLGRREQNSVLNDFSMKIHEGEIVGLVGKSGCGKSTLARCIIGIEKPDSGEIILREGMNSQMIFQDSQSAFNDRMTVEEIIAEPLRISGRCKKGGRRFGEKKPGMNKALVFHEEVVAIMTKVELDPSLAGRKPYELSGGQRQRVAIARALITKPDLIIADEPLTGLDVSAQAQIVHLFKRLADEQNLTLLFIAHDIPMVNHISDRVVKMEQ